MTPRNLIHCLIANLLWPLLAVLVTLLLIGYLHAAPHDAVVRIPSHGGSGTVVRTGKDFTQILSCAHAFEGAARTKPIVLDIPHNQGNPIPQKVRIELVAVNYNLDLSLINVYYGPVPYSTPIALSYTRLQNGHPLISAGYDEMKIPMTVKSATLLSNGGPITYTYEKPWHGRSGGGLFDAKTGHLVGVVQGYEVGPQGRGMYASLEAIWQFLTSPYNESPVQRPQGYTPVPRQQPLPYGAPQVQEFREPRQAPGPLPYGAPRVQEFREPRYQPRTVPPQQSYPQFCPPGGT